MNRSFTHVPALAALLMLGVATRAEALLVVEVNGTQSIALSSESTQQVGADGQTTHDIDVHFKFGAGQTVLDIFAAQLSDGLPTSNLSVTLRNISATGTLVDERVYGNVSIGHIEMAILDGSSRDELRVSVRLHARTMSVNQGGSVASKIGAKTKAILSGNFRLTLERMPTGRVLRINSHRFIPCASDLCDSVDRLDFVVRGATDIATWRNWFQKASAVPSITTSGQYELLSTDFATTLARVDFADLRPVSFSESSDALGPNARIVLSGGRVRLGF